MKNEMDTDILAEEIRILREDRIIFGILKIEEPMAKGLALGTAAHAIGTARALELGEIEGAMSSLAIAVSGLLTVLVVPLVSGLI